MKSLECETHVTHTVARQTETPRDPTSHTSHEEQAVIEHCAARRHGATAHAAQDHELPCRQLYGALGERAHAHIRLAQQTSDSTQVRTRREGGRDRRTGAPAPQQLRAPNHSGTKDTNREHP